MGPLAALAGRVASWGRSLMRAETIREVLGAGRGGEDRPEGTESSVKKAANFVRDRIFHHDRRDRRRGEDGRPSPTNPAGSTTQVTVDRALDGLHARRDSLVDAIEELGGVVSDVVSALSDERDVRRVEPDRETQAGPPTPVSSPREDETQDGGPSALSIAGGIDFLKRGAAGAVGLARRIGPKGLVGGVAGAGLLLGGEEAIKSATGVERLPSVMDDVKGIWSAIFGEGESKTQSRRRMRITFKARIVKFDAAVRAIVAPTPMETPGAAPRAPESGGGGGGGGGGGWGGDDSPRSDSRISAEPPRSTDSAIPRAGPEALSSPAAATDRQAPATRGDSVLQTALSMEGSHEEIDNEKVKRFLRTGQGWENLNPAETAWCAAFVNASLESNGIKGTGKLNAKSFLDWGRGVESKDLKPGDVGVMNRGGSGSDAGNASWQGHVGVVEKVFQRDGQTYVSLVGGNQGRAKSDPRGRSTLVSRKEYPIEKFIGFRRAPEQDESISPAPPAQPRVDSIPTPPAPPSIPNRLMAPPPAAPAAVVHDRIEQSPPRPEPATEEKSVKMGDSTDNRTKTSDKEFERKTTSKMGLSASVDSGVRPSESKFATYLGVDNDEGD